MERHTSLSNGSRVKTKSEVTTVVPRTASCCSSEPFPSLLGTDPLYGHAAAQRTVQGGAAMWPSSGQGEVKHTSEKALKQEGERSASHTPRSAGPPVCRTAPARMSGTAGALAPFPAAHHVMRASGLTAHTQGLQGPDTSWTRFPGSDSFYSTWIYL